MSSLPSASFIGTEPVGLAVIGHSGATGYNSDPRLPARDVLANSWATGSNPAVQSIYLRQLAPDPTIEGHATNIAIDGSDVISLISQAMRLVNMHPTPELVLIQTIDNDMHCDGTDEANYEPYRAKLAQALGILSEGLPESQFFIVSQWATVAAYDRVIFERNPVHLTGEGPCDTVDPETGKIVRSKETYVQGLVDAYWTIVTDVCGQVQRCRTDGGAAQQMDLVAADISSDLDHLSIAGHAKFAALEWVALTGRS